MPDPPPSPPTPEERPDASLRIPEPGPTVRTTRENPLAGPAEPAPTGEPPSPGPTRRWRFLAAMASLVAVIAAGIAYRLIVEPTPAPAPPTTTAAAPASPSAAPPVATPPAAPAPERPIVRRIVQVSSVPAIEQYPLGGWLIEKAMSGHLDGMTFAAAPFDSDMAGQLVDEDVVLVFGWAGDSDLGMRFKTVLFTMCGRVIASAAVGLARPDVARAVHPNLARSGWNANLLIGQLPRCDDAKLTAWAVAPFGRALFPLQGEPKLALAPARPLDPGLDPKSPPLVRPEQVPPLQGLVKVAVKGQPVNLRRCGATSCKVLGALKPGNYDAIMLDEVEGWALVLVPKLASGWVSRKAATITPAR